jgi:hypothetical protein
MVALALIVPALALTACGGGDKGSSDKDQITEIITTVGDDPSLACDHVSKAVLEAAFKGSVADCKKAAKADGTSDPDVKIDSITIDGDTATAKVTGNQGHQTIAFAKEGDDWLVGEVK